MLEHTFPFALTCDMVLHNIPKCVKPQENQRIFILITIPVTAYPFAFTCDTAAHAISDISQRLEAIDTIRKNERDLAAEYKTLLQVRRYVKLADEPKFVKGPKWGELSQEETENAKDMTAAEHSTELSKQNLHPDGKEPIHEEPLNRKAIRPEIDI